MGVSAEDGERSPDCRIAVEAVSAEGAAAVSQIVNGALPRVSSALLKVILVLPRPPPGEGQDSLPGVWAVSWIRNAQAHPGCRRSIAIDLRVPGAGLSGRGPTRGGQSVGAA